MFHRPHHRQTLAETTGFDPGSALPTWTVGAEHCSEMALAADGAARVATATKASRPHFTAFGICRLGFVDVSFMKCQMTGPRFRGLRGLCAPDRRAQLSPH